MNNSVFSDIYERESALKLLKCLLPEDFDTHIVDARVPANVQTVNKASLLGKCESLDLIVFELTHSSSSDARINISNDALRIMQSHDCIRALVIFYSESSEQWRLSLMTVDYKIDEGQVKKTISNPRRYSFLLGPGAKVHTPFKQLNNKVKDFEELLIRFSLEVVNKEFYESIAVLFTELVGGTRTVSKKKREFPGLLKLPRTLSANSYQEFAVRLIGRIVFCWFLKEKKSEEGVPLMPDELLSLEASKSNENYYETILEKLFFETLNVEIESRDKRYLEDSYKLVPYLNGGLFETHDGDFYKDSKTIPDSWITRLLEIFETYNFTIDENTISDVDLSIDPEMLGRIFENLLAEINPETGESARKSTGSFYTPREIVNYMVDESLVEILVEKTGIVREKINALVTYDKLDDLEFPLSQEQKEQVVNAVAELKILDPACGSGAYPIGILQKISMILQRADPDASLWFDKQTKSMPDPLLRAAVKDKFKNENLDWVRKLGIIKDVIYGIDIQPIAVEIAKLRCFLTLIVEEKIDDEQPNRGIQPLPNLDFKFVAANSLIQLEVGELNLLQDNDLQVKLSQIRSKYFNARTIASKTKLKEQYRLLGSIGSISDDARTKQLRSFDPFINNKTAEFFDAEYMFGVSEGFDICIGNPPYVSIWKMGKELKSTYEKTFETANGHYDLYVLFYELGIKLLKNAGVLCFITSNKWMAQSYGKNLRKLFLSKSILKLLDFSAHQVFYTATVDTQITLIQKIETLEDYEFKIYSHSGTDRPNMNELHFNNINTSIFKLHEDLNFKLNLTDNIVRIIDKINRKSIALNTIFYTSKGAELHNTKQQIKKERFIFDEDRTGFKRYIEGKYFQKYQINKFKYLDYQPQLHKAPAFPELFEARKLIVKNVIGRGGIEAILDERSMYNNDALINAVPYWELDGLTYSQVKSFQKSDMVKQSKLYPLEYVLGILNSRLSTWYFLQCFANGLHFYPRHLRCVRIPIITSENLIRVERIAAFVSEINLIETQVGESSLQTKICSKIDSIIYELFELNSEEIALIENHTE